MQNGRKLNKKNFKKQLKRFGVRRNSLFFFILNFSQIKYKNLR